VAIGKRLVSRIACGPRGLRVLLGKSKGGIEVITKRGAQVREFGGEWGDLVLKTKFEPLISGGQGGGRWRETSWKPGGSNGRLIVTIKGNSEKKGEVQDGKAVHNKEKLGGKTNFNWNGCCAARQIAWLKGSWEERGGLEKRAAEDLIKVRTFELCTKRSPQYGDHTHMGGGGGVRGEVD